MQPDVAAVTLPERATWSSAVPATTTVLAHSGSSGREVKTCFSVPLMNEWNGSGPLPGQKSTQ